MTHISALYNLLKRFFEDMCRRKIQPVSLTEHVASNFVPLMTGSLKMKGLDVVRNAFVRG
jgi:hypothetical protein